MFAAIINTAAHDGHVTEYDPADLTPGGTLTFQELCGSHGSILCESENRQDVQTELSAWLADCPAKNSGYCYTHNN